MKTRHLQSLCRRVKNALAAIHASIRFHASELRGDIEWDKPIYSELSKLQRERKKMEELAVALKRDLKNAAAEVSAARLLAKHGLFGLTVIADAGQIFVDENGGEMTAAEAKAAE